MALSKEIWENIQSYYETGKNPSEIVKLLDEKHIKIDRTSIVKRAKKENWSKSKIVECKLNHSSITAEELHQEFKSYINCDLEKLKTIKDIFELQKEHKKIQYIHIKDKQSKIREKVALDTIEQLLNIKLIRQFECGGFRIDGYDIENKIAYEIDEEHHRSTKNSQHDILRQKFIKEQLDCTFKRIKV